MNSKSNNAGQEALVGMKDLPSSEEEWRNGGMECGTT
jgi:hypothetical protein